MSKTIIERDFWADSLIIDEYSPEDKLFMLYLLTCPRGSAIGIFKIPIKLMAFEIGYSPEAIRTLLERFQTKYGRIKYDFDNQEIAIKNALKYSVAKGGKPVEDMIARELREVDDGNLIVFVYHNMTDFWDKSERSIDKAIKALFEDEILKRGLTYNANANANAKSYPVSYDDSFRFDDFNTSQHIGSDDRYSDSLSDTPYDSLRDFSSLVLDRWNTLDKNIPKLTSLNPGTQRYNMYNARLNQYGQEKFLKAINQIRESNFLKGYATDFVINFDWFVRPNNFIKVLEGNYKDKSKSSGGDDYKDYADKARAKRFKKMAEG